MTATQYPDGEPTKDRKNESGGSIARIGGVRVAAFYAAVLVGMAVQIVVFGIESSLGGRYDDRPD